ncbi:hypothetical protein HDU83_008332, partial [Entophlyctis luteolus]
MAPAIPPSVHLGKPRVVDSLLQFATDVYDRDPSLGEHGSPMLVIFHPNQLNGKSFLVQPGPAHRRNQSEFLYKFERHPLTIHVEIGIRNDEIGDDGGSSSPQLFTNLSVFRNPFQDSVFRYAWTPSKTKKSAMTIGVGCDMILERWTSDDSSTKTPIAEFQFSTQSGGLLSTISDNGSTGESACWSSLEECA